MFCFCLSLLSLPQLPCKNWKPTLKQCPRKVRSKYWKFLSRQTMFQFSPSNIITVSKSIIRIIHTFNNNAKSELHQVRFFFSMFTINHIHTAGQAAGKMAQHWLLHGLTDADQKRKNNSVQWNPKCMWEVRPLSQVQRYTTSPCLFSFLNFLFCFFD